MAGKEAPVVPVWRELSVQEFGISFIASRSLKVCMLLFQRDEAAHEDFSRLCLELYLLSVDPELRSVSCVHGDVVDGESRGRNILEVEAEEVDHCCYILRAVETVPRRERLRPDLYVLRER